MSLYMDSSGYMEGGALLNDRQFTNLMDGRWRSIYPAPFFDPIAMQTIADPKVLIQWSRFFYDWHPIIHAAINKMVSYPITDFIFDTKDEKIRKNYESLFQTLNIRSIMIRAGLDYFICGNAYASFIMPFKRMFKCPKCSYTSSAETTKLKASMSKLSMVCNKCGATVEPIVEDSNTQDVRDMKVILWNPINMQVDHDEVMDNTEYYYSLPNYVKTGILKGERKYIAKYPMYFIKAAHEKKLIRFYNDKLLHIKRETHSATYHKGMGQPLTTAVLKPLFHLMVLMRAQDALAIDQILPWNVLSPAPNAGTDPAGDMDLGGWKDQVKAEYEAWKKNPLRKSFMPVPINAQMIGAQGKALMVTPEIDAITNQILAGMGVPNEFVFGGLQWSGASVSLRMLENQFINYRTMMQRLLDWIVEQISTYFGYPPITVKMQNFKMADDVAQKQLVISLAQTQVISNETMLQEVMPELDFSIEREKIEREQIEALKTQADIQRSQSMGGLSPNPMSTMTGMQPSMQMAMPGQMPGQGGQGGQGGPGVPAGMAASATPLPESKPPRAQGANQQI